MTHPTLHELASAGEGWRHDWKLISPSRLTKRHETFMCTRCRLVLDALMPYEHLYQASTGEKLDSEPPCLGATAHAARSEEKK